MKSKSKKWINVLFLIVIVILLLVWEKIEESPENISQKIEFPEIEEKTIEETESIVVEAPQEENVSLGGYVSASFTDIFSGTAWLDSKFTNLYFDYRGEKLLFPPKIIAQEILPADGLLDTFVVSSVASNNNNVYFYGKHRLTGEEKEIVWETREDKWESREALLEEKPKQAREAMSYQGEVSQENGKWIFRVYQEGKKILEKESEYEGNLNIGQCGENVLVVFSSYYAQAFEITPQGEIIDKTKNFGWRVSEKGEKIYEGLPCYLKNTDGSIIRWDGEIPVEISKFFRFNYSPSFLEMVKVNEKWYLITQVPNGGTKVYNFFDEGFDLTNWRQVVSQKINFEVPEIKAAMIGEVNFGGPAKFNFYLSNDKGKTWQEANQGSIVYFKEKGNDLRWACRIEPLSSTDSWRSPWLDNIFLRYWYLKT